MRLAGRRRFLAAVSVGVVGASGCVSLGSSDDEGAVRPEGEPAVVPPPLECDDDSFERLEQPYSEDALAWGDHSGDPLRLRVTRTDYALGDEVSIALTNEGESTVETGHRSKYSVQLRTTETWQDVRVAPEDVVVAYPDVLVRHDPGEGFEWELELTEEGMIGTFDSMEVCPTLQPGRYRFVYWGLPDDGAVGVAFYVEDAP